MLTKLQHLREELSKIRPYQIAATNKGLTELEEGFLLSLVQTDLPAILDSLEVSISHFESILATEYACGLCKGEDRCTMHTTAREALSTINKLLG